jgi:hydrogenase maturation factor
VEKGRVPMPKAVKEVTELAKIDPFTSISEGTMIIVTDKEVVNELKKEGIEAEIIGTVEEGDAEVIAGNKKIERPEEDPFWKAFSELANKI